MEVESESNFRNFKALLVHNLIESSDDVKEASSKVEASTDIESITKLIIALYYKLVLRYGVSAKIARALSIQTN